MTQFPYLNFISLPILSHPNPRKSLCRWHLSSPPKPSYLHLLPHCHLPLAFTQAVATFETRRSSSMHHLILLRSALATSLSPHHWASASTKHTLPSSPADALHPPCRRMPKTMHNHPPTTMHAINCRRPSTPRTLCCCHAAKPSPLVCHPSLWRYMCLGRYFLTFSMIVYVCSVCAFCVH